MRFASTHTDESIQNVSLKQYAERMQDGQEAIYYVVADNHVTAKNSPHIEVFRKKGIEVLLLSDRIDDWLMGHLNEFDGKALKDIAKGELDLGESTEEEKAELEAAKAENEGLLDRLKSALDGRVSEVRPTLRLTDSPACLVVGEHELGAQMRRILDDKDRSCLIASRFSRSIRPMDWLSEWMESRMKIASPILRLFCLTKHAWRRVLS